MGQDIHYFVEVQDDRGAWHLAPHQGMPCPHCDGTGRDPVERVCTRCGADPLERGPGAGTCPGGAPHPSFVADRCRRGCFEGRLLIPSYFSLRDLVLFLVLRGAPSANPPLPLAGRGMPPDACTEVARAGQDVNWHGHTFATLEELDRYPWESEDFTEFAAALEKMRRLHADPACVRAVIWFDN